MRSSKSSSSRLTAVAVTSLPICRIISKVKKQTKQRRNRWRQTSGQICCLVIVLGFKRHRFDDFIQTKLYRFNLEHFWFFFCKMKNKKAVSAKTQNNTFTFECRLQELWLLSLWRESWCHRSDSESKSIEVSCTFFLSWKSEAGSVILLVVFISLHPVHFRDDTASLALACS